MNELFYFPKAKVNSRVSELVNDGYDIRIGDYTYVNLIRKPRNRRILRKLQSSSERIIIYS